MPFALFLTMGLRLAAAVQWILLVYWTRRREHHSTATLLFNILSVSVAGYLLSLIPFAFGAGWIVGYLFLIPAFSCAPFLWLSSKAFFQDDFRLRPVHLVIAAVGVIVPFLTHPNLPTAVPFYFLVAPHDTLYAISRFLFPQVVTLVFVALAILASQREKRFDLVEDRLRYRRLFVFGICGLALLVCSVEYFSKVFPEFQYALGCVTSSSILAFGYVLTQNLQHPENSILLHAPVALALAPPLEPASAEPAAEPAAGPEQKNSEPLNPEARERLRGLLDKEKVFLRPNLDLEELSRLVKLPEYRVRRHINQVLGYRNFNQFLNFHRVEEAKRILGGPGGRDVPIFNLSQDLGYSSVTSFNRVFRDVTGMAPTQFRDGKTTAASEPAS